MEVSNGREPVGRVRGWAWGGQDGKRARGPWLTTVRFDHGGVPTQCG